MNVECYEMPKAQNQGRAKQPYPLILIPKGLGGSLNLREYDSVRIGGNETIMEFITHSILSAIGNYIVIGIAFVLLFFIKWVVKRIKCLVLCMVAMMQGQIELGVNGDIKKRFDHLIEQITKD